MGQSGKGSTPRMALPCPAFHAAPGLPSTNVAWLAAAADADIERAFAQARAEKKPVLLYWGATWCPPCNQLKATLFNRQDFASAVAQLCGRACGRRPPRRAEAGQALQGQRLPHRGAVQRRRHRAHAPARRGRRGPGDGCAAAGPGRWPAGEGRAGRRLAGKPVGANEWRLLAFLQLGHRRPATGAQGRSARHAGAAGGRQRGRAATGNHATRLWLKALAASDDGQGIKADAALRERVQRVLADPAQSRAQMDVPDQRRGRHREGAGARAGPGRVALVATRSTTRCKRLEADTTLSRGNRLDALISRMAAGQAGPAQGRRAGEAARAAAAGRA
jgi:hypothetical protein